MQITIREPGSAITHFIGMMMAVFAAIPLLIKAGLSSGTTNLSAMAIFMASMILLYGASATYHSVNLTGKALRIFRKLDHMMIFVLIAGSYTPVCLIVLGGSLGYALLALVWGIALAGMLIKALWITCPKWFSSVIYIAMGWVCVLVFGRLLDTLSLGAFLWLLTGIKTSALMKFSTFLSWPAAYATLSLCTPMWLKAHCPFVYLHKGTYKILPQEKALCSFLRQLHILIFNLRSRLDCFSAISRNPHTFP